MWDIVPGHFWRHFLANELNARNILCFVLTISNWVIKFEASKVEELCAHDPTNRAARSFLIEKLLLGLKYIAN